MDAPRGDGILSVDREQVRRDAETTAASTDWSPHIAAEWAARCLALLAELEQVERKLDEALAKVEVAEDRHVERMAPLLEVAAEQETRLAKVPALVEPWEGVRVLLAQEVTHDALAYVEMRADVLGPNDPLVVLADLFRELQALYPSDALAAWEEW